MGKKLWYLATVAGMASYLDAGVIVSVGLSLSLWRREFGLTAGTIGMISAALTFSIAVGSLFGGRLADMFGRRRMFTLDLLVYVVGVALIAAAVNPSMIVVGVVIAGLAAGADLPTSVAVVAELAPAEVRGRLVAFTQVMWGIGIAVVTALGFVVSKMGISGARLLFVHLAVLGAMTWAVRTFSTLMQQLEDQAHARADDAAQAGGPALPLRELFGRREFRTALILTACFYVAWGLMANTWGQFKAYFLTTVSGATQSSATAWLFIATVVGVLAGVVFAGIADGPWRRPLFFLGAVGQIIAMLLGALTGGETFWIMVLVLFGFNLGYPFAGEAIYKVWTQESFPVNARATAQGFTNAVARFVFAGFAAITPQIMDDSPSLLLWILVGCATGALLLGSLLIRRDNAESMQAARRVAVS
ncbi:MFS transporter [Nocardia panacis]|uniref:MFS transporter n=1 Tax=Nocardia panacis TaxID=2340916 RepID=A0A3A4KHH7_9NOCA|nr:MFS transporter [Nocardia panacis]